MIKTLCWKDTVDPRVRVFTDNKNTKTYFYGAHNLDGHRNLLKLLKNKKNFDAVVLNFSSRPDNEIENIIKLYNEWFCCRGNIFVNTNSFFKCGDSSKITKIVDDLGSSKNQLISSVERA